MSSGLRTRPSTDVNTWVYANGYSGEETDLVPDICEGVTVTLIPATGNGADAQWGELGGLSVEEIALLKSCLGDSDGDVTNNAKVSAHSSLSLSLSIYIYIYIHICMYMYNIREVNTY